MQGNPCYARLFADLPYTPQGAFSCPFGTIHLAPPNPIKASGGRSRAPPVARGARRKPSEQGSARKTLRADAARPLRTALRPPNPGGFSTIKRLCRFFFILPPAFPLPRPPGGAAAGAVPAPKRGGPPAPHVFVWPARGRSPRAAKPRRPRVTAPAIAKARDILPGPMPPISSFCADCTYRSGMPSPSTSTKGGGPPGPSCPGAPSAPAAAAGVPAP